MVEYRPLQMPDIDREVNLKAPTERGRGAPHPDLDPALAPV